ncbi:MarC family protein [Shigella flexneri]
MYSSRIAGVSCGDRVMSMISGKLARINRTTKSETAVRESIGAVLTGVAVDGGARAISSTIVWGTRYHSISYLFGFFVAIALFAFMLLGIVPDGTVAGTGFYARPAST